MVTSPGKSFCMILQTGSLCVYVVCCLSCRLRPGWEALRDYLCGDEGLRATGVKKER